MAKTASKPGIHVGINIGISEKDRASIAKGLSHLLADTYMLYLTTHNFHWNVTGPMFNTLHQMFPLADKASDEPTADLLTQRLTVHEQTAWMLRSLLEE